MLTLAEGPMPRSRYGFRPCATACSPPTRVASAVPTAVDLVVLPLAAGGSLLGKALRHSRVVTFQEHAGGDSISLHPLAPPALPGFNATMGALTPVDRPRGRSDHQQVSLLKLRTFRPFRLQPPLTFPIAAFGFCGVRASPREPAGSLPDRHPSREVVGVTWASPLTSRLAKATGRIEFTCVTDESFASGCSPPRLATTQLPSATRSQTSSRRGLAPRLFSTFTGALVITLRVMDFVTRSVMTALSKGLPEREKANFAG